MKRALTFLLAVLMMAGLLAGCGNGGENPSASTSTEPSADPSYAAPTSTEPGDTEIELPLTTDEVSFDYWVPNSASFEDYTSFDDNLFYQWMEDQTGVHLNFIHPSVGSENEAFSAMILSREYPDFISFFSSYYSGGVDKAINDGVLRRLNELVDRYMPNYNLGQRQPVGRASHRRLRPRRLARTRCTQRLARQGRSDHRGCFDHRRYGACSDRV